QKGGGGSGGSGGTTLTPKARDLVAKYRQLQEEIEAFTDKRFQELFNVDLKPAVQSSSPDKGKL
ncbi:MAG: hypothetical protein ACD_75C01089G0006, partial [uncultured bacterium]